MSRGAQPSARLIKRSLLAGILSTGVHVDDLRVMPAAVGRHLLKNGGYRAGVHVRQSAIDHEAVQIDIFEKPGIQASPALEKEINKHFSRHEFRRASYTDLGELGYPGRAAEGYVDDLLRTLDADAIRRRAFRVVVDYCYSPASLILPLVIGPLGVEQIAAHSYVTGRAQIAEGIEAAIEQTKRLVTVVGAQLGVAMDEAAERLYLVDERGEAVPPEQCLLLYISLLGRGARSGTLALPITATSLADELADEGGLTVRRTQASLASLTQAASEDDTIFAGAISGGFVFPSFLPAYDAMASLCNLLQLLAPIDEPLSSLVDALPHANVLHTAVRCPWALKGTLMRLLTERLKNQDTDLLDGIKVFHDHGWTLVIPDPDEPLVHLYAEGDSAEEAERLHAEVRELVDEILTGERTAAGVP
jgi:mannose-1-phosphate guanylyltransferase/phosphomannomutase